MSRVTSFYRATSKSLLARQAQEHLMEIEDPDVTRSFPAEVNYIARGLGIRPGQVEICDHPCGEYTIFVHEGERCSWKGYVDMEFYFEMDRGVPFGTF